MRHGARTRHPKITCDRCDLSDDGVYVLFSFFLVRSAFLFDFLSLSFHPYCPFAVATFFLLRQHYYYIHIRIAFSLRSRSLRTSFIINKMLIFFSPLSLSRSFSSFSLLPHHNFLAAVKVCTQDAASERQTYTQNYTPIYLFGLLSPFSCYSYFMVDEIF